MDTKEYDSDFGFKVGDAVLCNGYEGNIGRVCTGVLKGMYEVRLMRGITCVSGSDLKPLSTAA